MVEMLDEIVKNAEIKEIKEIKDYMSIQLYKTQQKIGYDKMPRSVEYDCDCGDGSNCDY
jgi:hypothetical protein